MAVVFPVLWLAYLASAKSDTTLLACVTALVYFGTGLFTAAMYALLMELTNPAIAATQFSSFMGGVNACEAWSGYTAGQLVGSRGYAFAFVVMAGLALLSTPLLIALRLRPTPPPVSVSADSSNS